MALSWLDTALIVFVAFQLFMGFQQGFLLGMVTPPVGACWFLANQIAGARLEQTAVEMIPYMLIEVVVLLLMFAVPVLTLGIPRALGLM